MKILSAIYQWIMLIFGNTFGAIIGYQKGKSKAIKDYKKTVTNNKNIRETILKNLKNSPKYKEWIDKGKILIIVCLFSSCATNQNWNENYCSITEKIDYDTSCNMETQFKLDLHNETRRLICEENYIIDNVVDDNVVQQEDKN